jgi:hypothetical protein
MNGTSLQSSHDAFNMSFLGLECTAMKAIFQEVFPGLMLMWVCFIANGVFMDIFKEYKTHTMSRLMASGVTLGQIFLGKLLGRMLQPILQVVLLGQTKLTYYLIKTWLSILDYIVA